MNTVLFLFAGTINQPLHIVFGCFLETKKQNNIFKLSTSVAVLYIVNNSLKIESKRVSQFITPERHAATKVQLDEHYF